MGCLGTARHRAHIRAMEPIFDRRVIRLHRDRAAATVERVAPILGEVADRLLDRLDDTTRVFTRALDVGGRGVVAPRLRARGIITLTLEAAPRMARRDNPVVVGDVDALPFAPASFDLVVANLSLHWVTDLPGALIQLRQALMPDGLLLATLPALGTLGELRTALTHAESMLTGGASPRVSPFAGLADCAGLLQRAGFALPVVDSDTIELLYADPLTLLHELRAAGETNAVVLRDRNPPPPELFAAALAALPQRDGRSVATLRLAMLTGWAPGPGQPQPAARGSGEVRMADAFRGPPSRP
jgi:NADH dehydrogenase [ubiquinone] 1 alpha subcomplex assembly factor 5